MTLERVRKTGRCADGAERDGGRVTHLLDLDAKTDRALCGTRPGRLSAGWDPEWRKTTIGCARCQARAARLAKETAS